MRKDVEAEGREESRRNVVKNVLVIKCNKNVKIPYSGETYQWKLDGVALLV